MTANGTRLHVVQAGPEDGPLVVLLHGFPEFWYAWKDQIPALADAGFRVLAPDQRGFNLSDRPRGVRRYNPSKLVRDIIGLIDATGRERAAVIAHDWGGHVGWWLATDHPDRVERLVAVNIAHPRVMVHAVLTDLRQLRKSWYIFLIQVPWIPEWMLSRKKFAILRHFLRWEGQKGPMRASDTVLYQEAWSQPRAMTTMLNWYRASFRTLPMKPRLRRVAVPTMLLWGEQDPFLHRSLAQKSMDLCDDGRLEFFAEGTHWIHHEDPDAVNALIMDFLRP